jgi:hypothetical protein
MRLARIASRSIISIVINRSYRPGLRPENLCGEGALQK